MWFLHKVILQISSNITCKLTPLNELNIFTLGALNHSFPVDYHKEYKS